MVVYMDLVLAINFLFNFILVTIAGWIGLQRFHFGRYSLAALAGTAVFIFYFWSQYIFIDWLCLIGGAVIIVLVAWGVQRPRLMLANTAILVIGGQLMGGGIYSLAFALETAALGPQPLLLVVGGAAILFVMAAWWAGRIHRSQQMATYVGEVSITFQSDQVTVPVLLDSGNTLRHPVNNWPVVIIERWVAQQLLPPALVEWLQQPTSLPPERWYTQVSLIPYQTVGNKGLVAALRPDQVEIRCNGSNEILTQVYIALHPQKQRPLEHPALAFPIGRAKKGGSNE